MKILVAHVPTFAGLHGLVKVDGEMERSDEIGVMQCRICNDSIFAATMPRLD